MNVTFSIDQHLIAQARKRAKAMGKDLNQLICDYLQTVVDGDDAERSIQEFKRLSDRGQRRDWCFNQDEIHERS